MCYLPRMDLERLQPEDLADPDNPLNDRYYNSLRSLRSLSEQTAKQLKPRSVEIARRHHAGESPKEIAKALGLGRQSVYNHLSRPKVQELLEIFRRTAALIDGPTLALRRAMTWRIAVANELDDPMVALNALKELNKVSGAYPVQAPQVATVTNITINGELLPRTTLDDAPGA